MAPARQHRPQRSGSPPVSPTLDAPVEAGLDAPVDDAGLHPSVEPRGADASAMASRPLPMSREEMEERGWDAADIVFVTGDAYVDHPSFAMAILGRVLEASGFRVAILAQPPWRDCEPWTRFGRPRLFFAVSAGNMDSMLNHYTASRKVRNDDAYSPGGRIGLRPDRATIVYAQRCREAFPGAPVIIGGVEASLRRLAHYDYWSDTVRRSILLDAKADLLVFGMGESAIVEIARRLRAGESLRDLRDMRGVAFALGASEPPPQGDGVIALPSFEEVRSSPAAFAEATRRIHLESNPHNARTLVQVHDRRAVVCNPPRFPESQSALDSFYDIPYTRRPHPIYREPIPAHEVIKDSVTILRGCFGGCAYCSITTHQGRIVQSRSRDSILREVRAMAEDPAFSGIVSDIGGPSANMYLMRCRRPEVEAICRRLSCIHPKICSLLETDHRPLIELLRELRAEPGIRRVLVASGVRMDLARLSPEYLRELAAHHVGGHLKVAQEHVHEETLRLMRRPPARVLLDFEKRFRDASRDAGKEQYIVPYFIASHPGSDLDAAIELAVFLKRHGLRPEQVQDFIPAPLDVAACMYHTGLDPITGRPAAVARGARERRWQRALLQHHLPENHGAVKEALIAAGREDLIGDGPGALIPDRPPAPGARGGAPRRVTRKTAGPGRPRGGEKGPPRRPGGSGRGYRPGRRSASRRQRRPEG